MTDWQDANKKIIDDYKKKIADVWISELIGSQKQDYETASFPMIWNKEKDEIIKIKDMSPIEIRFFLELVYFMETYSHFVCMESRDIPHFYVERLGNMFTILNTFAVENNECFLSISYQKPIGKYKIDFMLELKLGKKNVEIAIELDGHDFHEKTKEQAAHDKKRDRDLLAVGINTIRFTGSEVYKDATSCVKYVLSYVSKIVNSYIKDVESEVV